MYAVKPISLTVGWRESDCTVGNSIAVTKRRLDGEVKNQSCASIPCFQLTSKQSIPVKIISEGLQEKWKKEGEIATGCMQFYSRSVDEPEHIEIGPHEKSELDKYCYAVVAKISCPRRCQIQFLSQSGHTAGYVQKIACCNKIFRKEYTAIINMQYGDWFKLVVKKGSAIRCELWFRYQLGNAIIGPYTREQFENRDFF